MHKKPNSVCMYIPVVQVEVIFISFKSLLRSLTITECHKANPIRERERAKGAIQYKPSLFDMTRLSFPSDLHIDTLLIT